MKGILFDFNGTMFFDGIKHKEAWNAFSLKYRNKALSDEEMDHMHGQTNKQIIQMLVGDMSEEQSEALSKAKEAMYREACVNDPDMFHLVDGLETLLDYLKANNIPMTICSASIKDNIDFFISSFHLERWFDVDKIMYDDGIHLNKISMFTSGAQAIGVDLKNCIVIEDSISGIDFAYQCHVDSIIGIGPKEKHEFLASLPGVKHVIEDYQNSIDWFQEHLK